MDRHKAARRTARCRLRVRGAARFRAKCDTVGAAGLGLSRAAGLEAQDSRPAAHDETDNSERTR